MEVRGATVRCMTRLTGQKFFDEFKLSITKALADQLAEMLVPLKPRPLTEAAISKLDPRPGVYLLWHQNRRVYVGKAQESLPLRLRKHRKKLSGRDNLDIGDVAFVCLYVDEDLDAAAPEKLLIKKYQGEGGSDAVPWNTNGFGNNDPGRNRDRSKIESNHFDAHHPIRLAFDGLNIEPSETTVGALLEEIKEQLPYNIRFDKSSNSQRAYATKLEITAHLTSVEQVINLIVRSLPERWQATALPGYLILYPEQVVYPSALKWWRRRGNDVEETPHAMLLAPSGGPHGLAEDGPITEEEEDR